MSIHSAWPAKRRPLPPPTETARGTTKRERILRAAIEVFALNGYFNAKVSEIAKAAGVADGTILPLLRRQGRSARDDFREHTRNYLQSLERELAHVRRPEERIRIAIRHHLETLGRDRSLAIVAQVELRHSLKFMSLLSQQEVADYLNMLRKMIEHGQSTAAPPHHPSAARRESGLRHPRRDGDVMDPLGEGVRPRRQRQPDRRSGVDRLL